MKKLTMLACLFISLGLAAQAQKSNMIFFSEKGERFLLFLNGNQQNATPMSNVKIEQMPSSIYQVRILFENKENGEINDKVTLNPATEKTWKIRLKDLETRNKVNSGAKVLGLPNATNTDTKFVVRVLSEIPISTIQSGQVNNQQVIQWQPNGYGYNTNVNTNGVNTNINSGYPGGSLNTGVNVSADPNGNVNMNMNVGGMNTNVNTTGMQTQTTYSTTTTTTTTSNGGMNQTYNLPNTGHVGCAGPLSPVQFNVEKAKIKAQKTEAGRVIVIKKLINTRCLTSQQVFESVSTLVMSSNRLEVAKLAYNRCWDPDNYEVVFNAFAISSQVEELNAYIQSVNAGWGVVNTNVTINGNPGWSNNSNTTTTVTSGGNNGWNNQNNVNYVPGYNGPIGCPMPMSPSDFESAKSSIASKTFENTKLEVAKQIIGSNCLTSDQVKQLMKVFEFESTKLDFAKYAYKRTYDKGNYYKVNDAFEFESSIGDLQEYIKGE
jgi:hypothetical protein